MKYNKQEPYWDSGCNGKSLNMEKKKPTTLIQAMQMYTKLVENVPDFCSNIKDSSSSNTFLQIHKKVRNELLCLLVA